MSKNKKPKYYVVWEGHQPGIYSTWEEANKQIMGYKGALFKSFTDKKEAESAFKNGYDSVPKSESKSSIKYYVVWNGFKPGIYDNWEEAKKQISGFPKPIYKTFGSKSLAAKAFNDSPENYTGAYKKTKDLSEEEKLKIGIPIELSLCVDAACNSKGDFEYRGVWNFSKDEVFRVGPYKKGSNNIGEFLALVHALAFLGKHRDPAMKKLPIYSDSKIAMSWVRQKVCKTNQKPTEEVNNLIKRAEHWLKNNTFENPLLKWETKAWGEIPADFGRK